MREWRAKAARITRGRHADQKRVLHDAQLSTLAERKAKEKRRAGISRERGDDRAVGKGSGARITPHRACMLGAFGVSALFLDSTWPTTIRSDRVRLRGRWIRWIYFPLLISHIALAAAIVPLALITIYRAVRGEFGRHRRLARWTFPVWLYVSVTGVMVYWLLYRAGPEATGVGGSAPPIRLRPMLATPGPTSPTGPAGSTRKSTTASASSPTRTARGSPSSPAT